MVRVGRRSANMSKDWTWKKLAERETSHSRAGNVRPDLMIGKDSRPVRFHADHPTTPAIDRFMAMIKIGHVSARETGECWLWSGGDTFRVSDDQVTTPRRFIYEHSMGEELPDNVILYTFCGIGLCCRPGHLKPIETARKRFT